jgi:hypothetical protein
MSQWNESALAVVKWTRAVTYLYAISISIGPLTENNRQTNMAVCIGINALGLMGLLSEIVYSSRQGRNACINGLPNSRFTQGYHLLQASLGSIAGAYAYHDVENKSNQATICYFMAMMHVISGLAEYLLTLNARKPARSGALAQPFRSYHAQLPAVDTVLAVNNPAIQPLLTQ